MGIEWYLMWWALGIMFVEDANICYFSYVVALSCPFLVSHTALKQLTASWQWGPS
jgi:hypothetical protein